MRRLDDRALEYWRALPQDVGAKAIKDFLALDTSKVENRSSFFMGLLRQRQAGKDNDTFKEAKAVAKAAARKAEKAGKVDKMEPAVAKKKDKAEAATHSDTKRKDKKKKSKIG